MIGEWSMLLNFDLFIECLNIQYLYRKTIRIHVFFTIVNTSLFIRCFKFSFEKRGFSFIVKTILLRKNDDRSKYSLSVFFV
uniref:Uncharacterized protein n=1 Tax=Bartonella schoenbuchensis (strain DSM 13525 / NCTC 13165 / R1) TaxID=687861 RepID=E6YXI4_BARSR|nr:hypothetical protein B11C_10046 [Bartonella schoenbuchensis R1]